MIWQPPKSHLKTAWSNANKTTTAEVIFLALEIVSHNRPAQTPVHVKLPNIFPAPIIWDIFLYFQCQCRLVIQNLVLDLVRTHIPFTRVLYVAVHFIDCRAFHQLNFA